MVAVNNRVHVDPGEVCRVEGIPAVESLDAHHHIVEVDATLLDVEPETPNRVNNFAATFSSLSKRFRLKPIPSPIRQTVRSARVTSASGKTSDTAEGEKTNHPPQYSNPPSYPCKST